MYLIKLENVKNNPQDINIKEGDYISIGFHNLVDKDDILLLGSCQFIEEALHLLDNICRTNGFNARLVGETRGNAFYKVMKNS